MQPKYVGELPQNNQSNQRTILCDRPEDVPNRPSASASVWTDAEMMNLYHDPKARAFQTEQLAWNKQSEELAKWVLARLVVRDDCYGHYYAKDDGHIRSCTRKESVNNDLIRKHLCWEGRDPAIGLFTTSLNDQCLRMTIDIDCHTDEPELAEKNLKYALHIYSELVRLGFHPLLIHSNGKGGFHLTVLFNKLQPACEVRSFGLWLTRAWRNFNLPEQVEVFPKQDTIDGKYGNLVRLFGRHPKHHFYSKVWNGNEWLGGDGAINFILSLSGDSFELVPDEALGFKAEKNNCSLKDEEGEPLVLDEPVADDWLKHYHGDLRTLDIVELFESKGLDVRQKREREFEVECPWANGHTTGGTTAGILVADEKEKLFPTFHCFHDHCRDRSLKDVLAFFGKDAVDAHCGIRFSGSSVPVENGKDEDSPPIITPSDPRGTAKAYVTSAFSHESHRTLVHHQGQWLAWDGTKYVENSDDDIRAKTWEFLEGCTCWAKEKNSDPEKLQCFVPNRNTVSNVVDALKGVTNFSSLRELPCWIAGDEYPAPENIISFNNGLLDLEKYLSSRSDTLLPHSPKWFSSTCLPHDFDTEAECPRWIKFLDQVFEQDAERVQALQQWFGYCLTSDNRQQKYALLIGPPRSGKSTSMNVLTSILGSQNVANPSLTFLGDRFGLAPLVGKQAAIIADAHLGRRSDSIAILERLKSIVGGDPQNIDRKNRDEISNVVIKARFTISANELPRLPDASAALRSRTLLIPFDQSFEGREDLTLQDRLMEEIPGITNWALDGLRDLRESGRLLQPQAGQDILDDFVRLSSPQKAFLEDCCELGPDKSVLTKHLQAAWSNWCQEHGHESGSDSTFGTKLRAAVPGLKRSKIRKEGKQCSVYRGLALTNEAENRIKVQSGGLPGLD